jgi:hypothetical protein
MKTLARVIFLPFLFFAASVQAQESNPVSDIQEPPIGQADVHDFECMGNSFFSQLPVEYDLGLYCDAGYVVTKVAEDYSASEPFVTMRFWGAYDVKATETFLIEFYDGMPGEPGTNVVHSFNVTTTPKPTSFLRFSSVIHQIDVEFPSAVTLLNGWVSVSRTTLPYSNTFAWISKAGAGNALSYHSNTVSWDGNLGAPLFCLGGPPPVPVANWSIVIGLMLMAGFIALGVRKLV